MTRLKFVTMSARSRTLAANTSLRKLGPFHAADSAPSPMRALNAMEGLVMQDAAKSGTANSAHR